MNFLEFLASVIRSAAWPTVFMIAFFVLKDRLNGLPFLIKSLRYKDWEMIFQEQLDRVKTDAVEAGLNLPTTLPTEYRELYDDNKNRPHLIILESWLRLEAIIRERAKQENIKVGLSTREAVWEFRKRKLISAEDRRVLEELRRLRNRVVHGMFDAISDKEITEYLKLVSAIEAKLKRQN